MNIYCEFDVLKSNKNFENKKLLSFSKKFGTKIRYIEIDKEMSSLLKKDEGYYGTIFCKDFDYLSNKHFDFLTKELIKMLKYFLELEKIDKIKNPKVFIAGLGNRKITADSLGSKVLEKILATSKDINEKNLSCETFGDVFCYETSISSKTGVYTCETIKGICEFFKPDLVVLIDSLSCKNLKNLSKTFQVSNVGLTPGCQVQNKQPKIDTKFLKIPVISIGCPFVIDSTSIKKASKTRTVLTLKDIDIAVKKCADIISFSLNKVFHKNLSDDEIVFLTKE